MKKICMWLFIILSVVLIGCKDDTVAEYIKWKDDYFMQICSQAFDKTGDQITYEDVSLIEKMIFIRVINENTRIGVSLLNDPEMKIVDFPETPLKSIEDLAWFENLTDLEVFNNQFSKTEILREMPKLKTLILSGPELTTEQLEKIARYGHIENLEIRYFRFIDYSCLAEMTTLKNVCFKYSGEITKTYYDSLRSLPSENCLLDLSIIDHEALTSELYDVLRTHLNIEKIGTLYLDEAYNLEFFKDMKHLDTVRLRGGKVDLTGISQMTWLKGLEIWGENIDISLIQQLPELEYLELKGEAGEGAIRPMLSIRSLGMHKKLEKLSLNGFLMENLDGIENYPELKSFTGYNCFIEELDSLKSLTKLEYLDLDYNLITDISALRNLNRLKYLSLGNNEIKDIGPLESCRDLEYLDLTDTYVSDISPIYGFQKLAELRAETDFPEKDRGYTENDWEVVAWRKVLLSLSGLKYYVGGPPIDIDDDLRWLSENLPDVKYGYSDVG